jgi:predicted alpha/beta superfamily hydrolase
MEDINLDNSNSPVVEMTASAAVGGLRLHELTSRVLRNRRLLRVWLPPRYDAPENAGRRYPVFYLNDGQNLFDPATAFGGVDWQVDETADRLIRQEIIAPIIVVGIDNMREDRIREYIPYRTANPPLLRPRGPKYPDFLTREVMPFIEERYRVAKGAENTGLGGSSLGGLISLYVALVRPGTFGRLLLESPSLWVAQRKILRDARGFRAWPERVYLAVGTREAGRDDKDRQTVENVRALGRMMQQSGLDDGRLRLKIDEGATHSEAAWGGRFPEALAFLFRKES